MIWAGALLLFMIGAVTPSDSVATQTAVVDTIAIDGLTSIPREELLYLLDLAEHQQFDAKRLRAGIKRAFLKGIFDDIRIEKVSEHPLKLLIKVHELDRITALDITGADGVNADDLRSLLPLKKGDRYRPGLMQQGCDKVARELERRGFRTVTVSQSVVRDGAGGVRVTLSCSEQSRLRIERLVIEDPSGALPFFKGISEGDLYDETVLDTLTRKTFDTLARRHYVDSKIEKTFSDGVLHIRVQPGTRLELDFVGNSALGNSALTKETTFFEINAFNDNLVEESIVRMRQQYRRIGYPSVDIVPVIERTEDALLLTYYIEEGQRQLVKAVTFQGATVPHETLLKQVSFAEGGVFNPDLVEPNRESLQQFYHDSGYLAARVDTASVLSDEDGVSIDFSIQEGNLTTVASLVFSGNTLASADELSRMVPLRPGDPYSESALSVAKLRIADWYQKKGHAEIQIDFQVKLSGLLADVTIAIQEGRQTLFGKHVIVGNDKTRLRVLQRELLHKEGEPFNPSLFTEERMALNRTGLFSSIDISSELSEKGVRDIIYRVQEAPAGTVEFGFGYAEYEQFRAFFDIGYRNLWGLNDQVQFRVDASSLLKRITLSLYHPWAFEQRGLAFKALLIGERKTELNVDNHSVLYKSDRYGASAGFEKTFSPALKGELMYDLSHVDTYDVAPGVILSKEDVGTLIISAVRLGLTYDRRDNPLDPKQGYVLGATVKVTGPYLLSETSFNKLVVYANAYESLSKNIVAAVSLRGGFAQGYGSTDTLPIVERFFLGGRTTVRGYRQDMLGPKDFWGNPVGGDAFLMGNFELRTKIWNDLGLVTFFDTGNVWTKLKDISLTDLKSTVGVGLRYNTPVGPLRVDYGRKLNRQAGESPDAIHFSIGHAF